jgi:sugar/nucleoside kinase (ribokinase family)
MEKANYLILNKHEFSLFKRITWLSAEEITSYFEKVVITFSENGSKILSNTWVIDIESVENEDILDTTWAWEAYRAWLIRWLELWYSWKTSAQIWSLISSFSLSSHWAQNHFIEKKQLEMWYADEFKEFIKL